MCLNILGFFLDFIPLEKKARSDGSIEYILYVSCLVIPHLLGECCQEKSSHVRVAYSLLCKSEVLN